jgi:hypothetical protein
VETIRPEIIVVASFRIASWLIAAPLLLALVGCGPRYRTYTNYEPPADENGRQCALRCMDDRRLCRREKDLQVRECRIDVQRIAEEANLDLERDFRLDLKRYRAGRLDTPPEKPASVQPDYGQCTRQDSSLEGRCGGDFDLCYETCGGRIVRSTHCVANCEG